MRDWSFEKLLKGTSGEIKTQNFKKVRLKTLCLDRSKQKMDAKEGRECFPLCAGPAGMKAGS